MLLFHYSAKTNSIVTMETRAHQGEKPPLHKMHWTTKLHAPTMLKVWILTKSSDSDHHSLQTAISPFYTLWNLVCSVLQAPQEKTCKMMISFALQEIHFVIIFKRHRTLQILKEQLITVIAWRLTAVTKFFNASKVSLFYKMQFPVLRSPTR